MVIKVNLGYEIGRFVLIVRVGGWFPGKEFSQRTRKKMPKEKMPTTRIFACVNSSTLCIQEDKDSRSLSHFANYAYRSDTPESLDPKLVSDTCANPCG